MHCEELLCVCTLIACDCLFPSEELLESVLVIHSKALGCLMQESNVCKELNFISGRS